MGAPVTERAASLKELEACAQRWLQTISDKHLLILSGELGAGKTQFCQFVLKTLGVDDVSSPTFNLIHSYHLKGRTVHHLDLYRLDGEDELESIGLWDLFQSPALMLVEWGDKLDIAGFDLEDWAVERLTLSVLPGGVRTLLFEKL